VAPSFDLLSGVPQRAEPVQVEAFVAELAVQALDEGVLDRDSGVDEAQPDTRALRPLVSTGTGSGPLIGFQKGF
jgi:hypothetical protein